jgi:hypothetical protein
MNDIITIKSIRGSPYDISAVLIRLPYINVPCTITSFGNFENNFTLFNIDFLNNAITIYRFKDIVEKFRKMAFNHEIEPIYIRATNGEKETVIGVYGYKDVDYEGLC